jgi:hypothetical protein
VQVLHDDTQTTDNTTRFADGFWRGSYWIELTRTECERIAKLLE